MKKLAIIVVMLSSASIVWAFDSSLDNYYEFGRRGAQAMVEEEDLSDEFDYYKYNVKFSQKYRNLASYYIRYQYYNKSYDNLENLSNSFNTAVFGMDTMIYSADDFSIKAGPDFELKRKTYKESANNDYNQYKIDLPITFKREDDWQVKVSGGINSYLYSNFPKNQFKINSRIDGYKKFLDENIKAGGFYKIQYIDRQKIADRFERTFGASLDMITGLPFFRSIEGGFEYGMDNTIIYEEREDSHDYKYLDWFIKTKFHVTEKIRAYVKYSDYTRSYADFNHNFNGFLIENGWDAKVFEINDYSMDMNLKYMHKQFRYPYVSSPFSFHNNNIVPEMEIRKKGDWKAIIGSDFKFYDYPAKRYNDKIYYVFKTGVEKYLFNKSFVASFDYKYVYKNFFHRMTITENVFRFGLKANF